MYNRPFFISYYNQIPRTRGIISFSKLSNIFKGIKSFNWTGLINNTSKTLGIVNQSIPIVKQIGPVVGNMKSMIKLASIFKDETDITQTKSQTSSTNNTPPNNIDIDTKSPTFFIN